MTTFTTQRIANQAEIISNTFVGNGHRKLTILIDNDYEITYTTNAMHLTDNLGDDDKNEDAVVSLINAALKSNDIIQCNNFIYIF